MGWCRYIRVARARAESDGDGWGRVKESQEGKKGGVDDEKKMGKMKND